MRGVYKPRLILAVGCLASTLALAACAGAETTAVAPAESQAARPSAVPSPPPSDLATFYDQEVEWHNCGGAECAKILVPVDYANPSGATTELAATRVRAMGDSLGSLFVNPGGPGGSAFDYAKAADYIVTPDVRDRYDIVGIDPRGVAHSDPIECLTDAQRDDILSVDGTPDTPIEVQEVIAVSASVGAACKEKAGALSAQMGTANAARDLDIARAVVGDPVFNYLGKSYGSYLGLAYSQLFPSHVGRMVLDGILPADLGLEQISKEQGESFEVAFADFAADCATHDDCPFTGDGPAVATQLRDWIRSLDAHPIDVGGRALNEPVGTYAVLSYLYFPETDYADLRPALDSAVNKGDGKPLLDLMDQRLSRSPDGHYQDNSTEAFYTINCLDRPYEGTVAQVTELAKLWEQTAPTIGGAQAWGMLTCANWPARQDDAIRKITPDAAPPMLIVSTIHDPATPYQWGQRVADQLGNARLLTWDHHNHTAYFEGSECIDSAVDGFLLAGVLPPEQTTCQ